MELASNPPPKNEPWTAAVAWARPWHRPAPARRPVPAAARRVAWSPPAPAPVPVNARTPDPDPTLEIAWTVALIEVRAAELSLAEVVRRDLAAAHVDGHRDEWPELMARHALFCARQRLRLAQAALTGADAELAWSAS